MIRSLTGLSVLETGWEEKGLGWEGGGLPRLGAGLGHEDCGSSLVLDCPCTTLLCLVVLGLSDSLWAVQADIKTDLSSSSLLLFNPSRTFLYISILFCVLSCLLDSAASSEKVFSAAVVELSIGLNCVIWPTDDFLLEQSWSWVIVTSSLGFILRSGLETTSESFAKANLLESGTDWMLLAGVNWDPLTNVPGVLWLCLGSGEDRFSLVQGEDTVSKLFILLTIDGVGGSNLTGCWDFKAGNCWTR